MGVLDATWPQLQGRLYYSLLIWPSCGLSGRMKFSLTSKGIWAWYDAILFFFFFVSVMLITLFVQAIQATYRVEEITNSYYQQLDDERKRCVTDVQSFNIADQSNKDLRKKLAKEERARKSVDSALESAQSRPRSIDCSFVTPRSSWLLLKSRLPSFGRSQKKSKSFKSKLKG